MAKTNIRKQVQIDLLSLFCINCGTILYQNVYLFFLMFMMCCYGHFAREFLFLVPNVRIKLKTSGIKFNEMKNMFTHFEHKTYAKMYTFLKLKTICSSFWH